VNITLYLSQKQREYDIGNALKAGFEARGERVRIVPTQDYQSPDDSQLAVVIGIKGVSKQVMQDYTRSGRHCILVDKSYFGRTEYLRLSLDGFQPHYAHAKPRRPMDRWEKVAKEFRIKPAPMRIRDGYLIYAGSSQKYCDWHTLGNVSDFAERVCIRINKTTHSKRALLYRPKPSWKLLPDCHSVITHGSNAAVEAILAGVPAVVISRGTCAAEPVAGQDYDAITQPRLPSQGERLQWLADLAYCQFNTDEMASGLAWDIIAPQTVKASIDGDDDPESVIAQYRALHKNPKMFRGGSIKGHLEAIGTLVGRFEAETLLDYGCGKGLQYSGWKFHERWGVAAPTLYDPGVPGIDQKPSGTFDGVICTDVMEHIPEPHVSGALSEIVSYARKFAFLCIFTNPSRKLLPDGRNAHITIHEPDWWLDTICAAVDGYRDGLYQVTKVVPDGTAEFPHHVIRAASGCEVVVTFRGAD
jgi:hypothetical protein